MILVTGASGFLGQHLLQQLVGENKKIRALYHKKAIPKAFQNIENVEWIPCDLLDIVALEAVFEGIEEIYHCAAKVSFEANDKQTLVALNRNSTANVVNAALDFKVRKMVHVSSIATLGRADTSELLDENSIWISSNNNTVYAQSKYEAEMEVWRGIAEGLNAVIVNPSIILGVGSWTDGSGRLMQVAYNQFPFYTEGVNGWVAVQDVAKVMVMLMKSDICAERFILNEGNHAYKYIFSTMALHLNRKPPHIKAPKFAIGLLWRWNLLLKWLFNRQATVTKETTRTAQTKCYYNNNKFHKYFPSFHYTAIEICIKEMATDYLNQKK